MSILTAIFVVSCLAGLYAVKERYVGYNCFTAIFVAFFTAYGLVVPVADVLGLESLTQYYPSPHATGRYLLHFGLAVVGLAAGLGATWLVLPRKSYAVAPHAARGADTRPLFVAALALAVLASLFELINLQRIGGLPAVGFGKIAYQTKVDALTFTLPSYIVGNVAVAAMSLHVVSEWDRARNAVRARITLFILVLMPALVLAIVLTRRSELVAWILIVFVGATWTRNIRRVGAGLAAVIVVGYLVAPVLAVRYGYTPLERAWWNEFARRINPATDEFATPFGAYNEYTTKVPDEPLRWGCTYLDGFATAVPSTLWTGEKPKQIDMEVRDRAFPAYARAGGLQSPGFSPLLEALINFGTWGVAPTFVVFGLLLGAFELLRARLRPVVMPMAYLSFLPIAQTFHRSAFGPAVISVGAMTVLALALFLVVYVPIARRRG
jgi:hypothetical protein